MIEREGIGRRKFLLALGALAGGALACDISTTGVNNNLNQDPTLAPVTPISTVNPTLTETPTPTQTEKASELDPFSKAINELFKDLSYDPKTGLYEKKGKHYKFVNNITKNCPEQINFSLVEVSNECPTKPVKKVTKQYRPTESQPGQTPQRPPENPPTQNPPTHRPPENPSVTPFKPNNPGSAPTPTAVTEQNYQPPTLIPSTPVPATEMPRTPIPQPTSAPVIPTSGF